MNIKVGFSKELLELVVLGFQLSKLGSVGRLIGKSGLFHSRYSPKLADFVPSLWYGREGAGHIVKGGWAKTDTVMRYVDHVRPKII